MGADAIGRSPHPALALLREMTDPAAYRAVAAQVKYPVGAMLVAQSVLTFGSTAAISRLLGARAFGDYAVILTVAGIFRLIASFSVESAVPKYLAEARERGDSETGSYYGAALWLRLAASLLALLAAGLLARPLGRLYGVPELAVSIFLASIYLSVLAPIALFFLSCLQGLERPAQWSTANLLNSLVVFPLALVGAAGFSRWAQPGLMLWIAAGWALAALICAGFAWRALGFLWAKTSFSRLRLLGSFALPLWIGALVSFGAHTLLKSYLAVRSGPVPVGQFEIGLTLLFHMGAIHGAFMIVFLPAWARRYAAGQGGELLRSYTRVRGVLLGISTAYGLTLALAGHWVVPAVFGREQAGAVPAVRVMGLVMPMLVLSWLTNVTYVIDSRTGYVGRANVLWFAVVVPIGLLLIPGLGSLGAALAFLAAYFAFAWYCLSRARPFFAQARRWADEEAAAQTEPEGPPSPRRDEPRNE